MNRDDLVERVHSAMRAKLNHTPYMAPPDVLEECARAALAIIEPAVRGECARVADDYEAQTVIGDGGGLEDESVWSAASSIAAAIRAGAKP